jgi:hypothetical protein
MEEIRDFGNMSRNINATFIIFIPQKDFPSTFCDFCSISFCNCLYKITTKAIAIRLKPILACVISSEQFGFSKGRLIHEAIG